jgi:predicted nucleic acid-binding protein
VDAVELLEGDAPLIADTSAWWRFSSLPAVLAGLVKQAMDDDRLWITPIVRMEILYSTRSTAEYTAVGQSSMGSVSCATIEPSLTLR